jgi:hypothetical protein
MPAKAAKSECNNQTSIQARTSLRRMGPLSIADELRSTEMSEVPTTATLEEIMNARGWNGDFTPRFLLPITRNNPKSTQSSTSESVSDDLIAGSAAHACRRHGR